MKIFLFLSFGFMAPFTGAQTLPDRLVCVSWMNQTTRIFETQLSEYAMAQLTGSEGNEWVFEADVMEGSLNYVSLRHVPSDVVTVSRAAAIPLYRLSSELNVGTEKATVDCSLRRTP
ncbi:MAG: hypothetical protein ACK5Y2_08580 [Bdellovibrionales bacterium]